MLKQLRIVHEFQDDKSENIFRIWMDEVGLYHVYKFENDKEILLWDEDYLTLMDAKNSIREFIGG